jgi:hypothetical protein
VKRCRRPDGEWIDCGKGVRVRVVWSRRGQTLVEIEGADDLPVEVRLSGPGGVNERLVEVLPAVPLGGEHPLPSAAKTPDNVHRHDAHRQHALTAGTTPVACEAR